MAHAQKEDDTKAVGRKRPAAAHRPRVTRRRATYGFEGALDSRLRGNDRCGKGLRLRHPAVQRFHATHADTRFATWQLESRIQPGFANARQRIFPRTVSIKYHFRSAAANAAKMTVRPNSRRRDAFFPDILDCCSHGRDEVSTPKLPYMRDLARRLGAFAKFVRGTWSAIGGALDWRLRGNDGVAPVPSPQPPIPNPQPPHPLIPNPRRASPHSTENLLNNSC